LRWVLASACFALLLYFFSPPWAAFRAWSRVPELQGMLEVRRGASVLLQMAHPGSPIPDQLHGAIQWRLLFPVLGRLLHLSPLMLFALAPVGSVLVLGFIITVLRRRSVGFPEAAMAAVILGSASWYFASLCWLGYFDSWLVLGLLVVAFAERRWPVWLACVWAPWVDERFVVAVPLALLCRYLFRTCVSRPPAARFWWVREFAVPAGLTIAFVFVRLGLLSGQSGQNATVAGYLGGLSLREVPWTRVLQGVWEGLRLSWFFVVAAVILSWPQRGRAVALAAMIVAVMGVGLGTAQDLSRSMMLIMPAGLFGAILVFAAAPRWLPVVLRVCAGGALLLPAHLVMSDRVNPISGLFHELTAFRTPPPMIMPEFYELNAIRAMERGDFSQAESALTVAIKLAENPSEPYKQRGMLRASQGLWGKAREDFSAMVLCDPQNPEAWFFRAQSGLALGDRPGASSDMEQALQLAPDDWSARPDVARFLQRLGRPSPVR